jgi:hypothetical protein
MSVKGMSVKGMSVKGMSVKGLPLAAARIKQQTGPPVEAPIMAYCKS